MANQTDPTTGLDNFNAREYDPALGRFQSQDPVAGNPMDPQTFDPYAYGAGNPLANPDPTGMATAAQILAGGSGSGSSPFSDPLAGLDALGGRFRLLTPEDL